jgi:hypothetical protein
VINEEPREMGSIVRDADGHTWRRLRKMWVCEAPVGTSYVEARTNRHLTIKQVGRLPWYALVREAGPLTLVRLGGPRR